LALFLSSGCIDEGYSWACIDCAWLEDPMDLDGDGYLQRVTLVWATYCGADSELVYEKVYHRPAGTTPWTLYTTTSLYRTYGWGYVCQAAVLENLPRDTYEFRIELYNALDELQDTRDPAYDSALSNIKLELAVEDPPGIVLGVSVTKSAGETAEWEDPAATSPSSAALSPAAQASVVIRDAWWPEDGTGTVLAWDVDAASPDAQATVYERVAYRAPGGEWRTYLTTSPHLVAGRTPDDAQELPVDLTGPRAFDWRIEAFLLETGAAGAVAELGPEQDEDLRAQTDGATEMAAVQVSSGAQTPSSPHRQGKAKRFKKFKMRWWEFWKLPEAKRLRREARR
jgi:hypothetical protein